MGNSQPTPLPKEEGLRVVTQTWLKESHQLFDYYCSDIDKRLFYVKQSGLLMRNDNLVVFGQQPLPHYQVLAEIDYGAQQTTIVQQPTSSEEADGLWLVAQQEREIPLAVGDVLRLGRVEFKVREIGLKGARGNVAVPADGLTFSTQENFRSSVEAKLQNSRTSQRGLPQCRICFARDPSEHNPLITPCKCKGSLQYIHLLCLREWLQTKVTKKIYPMANYYSWKKLRCEICACQLAEQYTLNDRTFDIFSFVKPDEPYIMLQRTQMKEDGRKISVCITKLSENVETKLGRGQQVHVKINDISVSRHHSSLTLRRGKVYLSDKTSKFGTLVKLPQGTTIPNNSDLWLQCGRTLLKFENAPPLPSGCCCEYR